MRLARKLAVAIILMMAVSIGAAGSSARATTCRRVVITILNDPYFAHPICTDLPPPIDGISGSIAPPPTPIQQG